MVCVFCVKLGEAREAVEVVDGFAVCREHEGISLARFRPRDQHLQCEDSQT
jgi:hypothetical protein